MVNKKELRKEMLQRRDLLSEESRRAASEHILEAICSDEEYQKASDILCYLSFGSEVETRALIEQALADRKRVYLPRVEGKNMQFYRYLDGDKLIKSSYGIDEPMSVEPFDRDTALVIMPGVGFTLNGDRLGYGGGYYDKYFSDRKQMVLMAVAYDVQITEQIASEAHDLKPDMLITESRKVYFNYGTGK